MNNYCLSSSSFKLDQFNSLHELLEDLTTRFIINIPTLELESIESMFIVVVVL